MFTKTLGGRTCLVVLVWLLFKTCTGSRWSRTTSAQVGSTTISQTTADGNLLQLYNKDGQQHVVERLLQTVNRDFNLQADNQEARRALVQLYNTTSGDHWLQSVTSGGVSWNAPGASYCRWPGVVCCGSGLLPSLPCNDTNSVVVLDLAGFNLHGQLPSGIDARAFESLTVLNLQDNPGLSGGIPPVWLPNTLLWMSVQGTNLTICTDVSSEFTRTTPAESCTLPSQLTYDKPIDSSSTDTARLKTGIHCPSVRLRSFLRITASMPDLVARRLTMPYIQPAVPGTIQADVAFTSAYGCKCMPSRDIPYLNEEGQLECRRAADGDNHARWIIIVVLVTVLPHFLIGFGTFMWFKHRASLKNLLLSQEEALQRKRGKVPGLPSYVLQGGKGYVPLTDANVTWVSTDVSGSTALWEWDSHCMDIAIDLHNKVIRALLDELGGHEIRNEGDSFLLSFHEVSDGVRFCLKAQEQLQAAPWPSELSQHHLAKEIRVGDATRMPELAGEGPVVIAGLRVRMGINTGFAEQLYVHDVTKRVDYRGPDFDLTTEMCDIADGGQILMGPRTYHAWTRNNPDFESEALAQLALLSDLPWGDGSTTISRSHSLRHSLLSQASMRFMAGSGDAAARLSALRRASMSAAPGFPRVGSWASRLGQRVSLPSNVNLPHSHSQMALPSFQTYIQMTASQGSSPGAKQMQARDHSGSKHSGDTFTLRPQNSSDSQGFASLAMGSINTSGRFATLTFANLTSTGDVNNAAVAPPSPTLTVVSDIMPAARGPSALGRQTESTAGIATNNASGGGAGGTMRAVKRSSFAHLTSRLAPQASSYGSMGLDAPASSLSNVLSSGGIANNAVSAAVPPVATTNSGSNALPPSQLTNIRTSVDALQDTSPGPDTPVGRATLGEIMTPEELFLETVRENSQASRGGLVSHMLKCCWRSPSSYDMDWQPHRAMRLANLQKNKEAQYNSMIIDMGFYTWQLGADTFGKKRARKNSGTTSDEVDINAAQAAVNGDEQAAGTQEMTVHVVQLLPTAMAARALIFRWPLNIPDNCEKIHPGFFDAPGTSLPILPGVRELLLSKRVSRSRPQVSFAFSCIEGYKELQRLNSQLAQQCASQHNACVRELLSVCSGYECKETEGSFMVAFAEPAAAVEWALTLQMALLYIPWPEELHALHEVVAQVTDQESGQTLYKGLRARIGLYTGPVDRVAPNCRTGRADYFGTPVNRAARLMTAAEGGQIICDATFREALLSYWSQRYVIAKHEEANCVPVLQNTGSDGTATVRQRNMLRGSPVKQAASRPLTAGPTATHQDSEPKQANKQGEAVAQMLESATSIVQVHEPVSADMIRTELTLADDPPSYIHPNESEAAASTADRQTIQALPAPARLPMLKPTASITIMEPVQQQHDMYGSSSACPTGMYDALHSPMSPQDYNHLAGSGGGAGALHRQSRPGALTVESSWASATEVRVARSFAQSFTKAKPATAGSVVSVTQTAKVHYTVDTTSCPSPRSKSQTLSPMVSPTFASPTASVLTSRLSALKGMMPGGGSSAQSHDDSTHYSSSMRRSGTATLPLHAMYGAAITAPEQHTVGSSDMLKGQQQQQQQQQQYHHPLHSPGVVGVTAWNSQPNLQQHHSLLSPPAGRTSGRRTSFLSTSMMDGVGPIQITTELQPHTWDPAKFVKIPASARGTGGGGSFSSTRSAAHTPRGTGGGMSSQHRVVSGAAGVSMSPSSRASMSASPLQTPSGGGAPMRDGHGWMWSGGGADAACDAGRSRIHTPGGGRLAPSQPFFSPRFTSSITGQAEHGSTMGMSAYDNESEHGHTTRSEVSGTPDLGSASKLIMLHHNTQAAGTVRDQLSPSRQAAAYASRMSATQQAAIQQHNSLNPASPAAYLGSPPSHPSPHTHLAYLTHTSQASIHSPPSEIRAAAVARGSCHSAGGALSHKHPRSHLHSARHHHLFSSVGGASPGRICRTDSRTDSVGGHTISARDDASNGIGGGASSHGLVRPSYIARTSSAEPDPASMLNTAEDIAVPSAPSVMTTTRTFEGSQGNITPPGTGGFSGSIDATHSAGAKSGSVPDIYSTSNGNRSEDVPGLHLTLRHMKPGSVQGSEQNEHTESFVAGNATTGQEASSTAGPVVVTTSARMPSHDSREGHDDNNSVASASYQQYLNLITHPHAHGVTSTHHASLMPMGAPVVPTSRPGAHRLSSSQYPLHQNSNSSNLTQIAQPHLLRGVSAQQQHGIFLDAYLQHSSSQQQHIGPASGPFTGMGSLWLNSPDNIHDSKEFLYNATGTQFTDPCFQAGLTVQMAADHNPTDPLPGTMGFLDSSAEAMKYSSDPHQRTSASRARVFQMTTPSHRSTHSTRRHSHSPKLGGSTSKISNNETEANSMLGKALSGRSDYQPTVRAECYKINRSMTLHDRGLSKPGHLTRHSTAGQGSGSSWLATEEGPTTVIIYRKDGSQSGAGNAGEAEVQEEIQPLPATKIIPMVPVDVSLWVMGSYRLKGVTELVKVYELLPASLEQRTHINAAKTGMGKGKARCVQRLHACTEHVSIMLPDVTKLSCCSLEIASTGAAGNASGLASCAVNSSGHARNPSGADAGMFLEGKPVVTLLMAPDSGFSDGRTLRSGDALSGDASKGTAGAGVAASTAPPSSGVNVDNKLEWHGHSALIADDSLAPISENSLPQESMTGAAGTRQWSRSDDEHYTSLPSRNNTDSITALKPQSGNAIEAASPSPFAAPHFKSSSTTASSNAVPSTSQHHEHTAQQQRQQSIPAHWPITAQQQQMHLALHDFGVANNSNHSHVADSSGTLHSSNRLATLRPAQIWIPQPASPDLNSSLTTSAQPTAAAADQQQQQRDVSSSAQHSSQPTQRASDPSTTQTAPSTLARLQQHCLTHVVDGSVCNPSIGQSASQPAFDFAATIVNNEILPQSPRSNIPAGNSPTSYAQDHSSQVVMSLAYLTEVQGSHADSSTAPMSSLVAPADNSAAALFHLLYGSDRTSNVLPTLRETGSVQNLAGFVASPSHRNVRTGGVRGQQIAIDTGSLSAAAAAAAAAGGFILGASLPPTLLSGPCSAMALCPSASNTAHTTGRISNTFDTSVQVSGWDNDADIRIASEGVTSWPQYEQGVFETQVDKEPQDGRRQLSNPTGLDSEDNQEQQAPRPMSPTANNAQQCQGSGKARSHQQSARVHSHYSTHTKHAQHERRAYPASMSGCPPERHATSTTNTTGHPSGAPAHMLDSVPVSWSNHDNIVYGPRVHQLQHQSRHHHDEPQQHVSDSRQWNMGPAIQGRNSFPSLRASSGAHMNRRYTAGNIPLSNERYSDPNIRTHAHHRATAYGPSSHAQEHNDPHGSRARRYMHNLSEYRQSMMHAWAEAAASAGAPASDAGSQSSETASPHSGTAARGARSSSSSTQRRRYRKDVGTDLPADMVVSTIHVDTATSSDELAGVGQPLEGQSRAEDPTRCVQKTLSADAQIVKAEGDPSRLLDRRSVEPAALHYSQQVSSTDADASMLQSRAGALRTAGRRIQDLHHIFPSFKHGIPETGGPQQQDIAVSNEGRNVSAAAEATLDAMSPFHNTNTQQQDSAHAVHLGSSQGYQQRMGPQSSLTFPSQHKPL